MSWSFGQYRLEVVAETVVLCDLFRAGPPVPQRDRIVAAALALADFAGRQAPYPEAAETQHAFVSPPTQQAYVAPPTQHAYVAPPTQMAYPQQVPHEQPGYDVPRQHGTSINSLVIAAAIIAVGIIVAAAIFAFSSPDDRSSQTATPNGADTPPASAEDVGPCASPPKLEAESTRFDDAGLTVSTRISPSCPDGDLLSNDRFRVTVVDEAGKDVAAGIFDLSSTPVAIGGDGMSAEFTFPANTYWQTKDSITGDLRLTAYNDGRDRTTSGDTGTDSAFSATDVGKPESDDVEGAARSGLADIAAADRAYIDAKLLDVWQPQLSSKRPGLFADGITWSNPDIVREHMELRQRYPDARLLWSGDWPVYEIRNWWITVSGIPMTDDEQALRWCAREGYDADHCFAKLLSHNRGPVGTTRLQE